MVTAIVKQLRDAADASLGDEGDLYLDAAYHIQTLERIVRRYNADGMDVFAEIARLKAALEEIGNVKRFGVTPQTELAQSALRGSE